MALIFVNRYFYPDISATSQMLSDLARHAASDGATVRVITSRQRLIDARARLPVRENVDGVQVYRVWSTCMGRGSLLGRAIDYLSFHCSTWIMLLRLLAPGDRVIAATDPPMLGVGVSWFATLRGARVVNWLHDIFPETAVALGVPGLDSWLGRSLMSIRDRSLRAAALNVVIGDAMAAYVHSRGVPMRNIRVIHNWSDGQAITPVTARDNPLRDTWGLQGKMVVGYSGNIGRAHDLALLPAVAARFSGCADIVFLVIGDGAGLPALRERVQALGLSNVVFKPYQPRTQLNLSLSAIDVHLISLRPQLEGLIVPSKLYGALAAGRASVFMGDVNGEVARLLSDSGAGRVCGASDEQALYDILQQLHANDALREGMGKMARALLWERYDQRHALASWLSVLNSR